MDDVVFFMLNGFFLALYPSKELAADTGILLSDEGWKRFSFSINFRSEDEVDQKVAQMRQKGVNVVKDPQKVFWGSYNAYIKDGEFNFWELAYNPF